MQFSLSFPSTLNRLAIKFPYFFFQFIAKNTKKRYRWNASISARNILNTLIPVIAYEQTRFDYIRFNKEKFPIKYLMDAGASYSIRIQLQIQ